MTVLSGLSKKLLMTTAMMAIAVAAFAADAPTTSSFATTQVSSDAEQIQSWVEQLADTDPAVREIAKVNLLGLRRAQLGILHSAVERSLPLAPSQLADLSEIVQ